MSTGEGRLATVALGSAAFLVPLVYFPGIYDFTLHPRLFILQLMLLIVWGSSALGRRVSPSFGSPLLLPLFAFAAVSVASVFWAVNPVDATLHVQRLFTFLLLAIAAATALDPKRIPTIYAGVAAAGCVASLLGIAQYLGWEAVSFIPTVGNPSATFGYRNYAASFLVGAIPPALAFAWTSDKRRTILLWTGSVFLMTVFLVLTRTRGAWLSIVGTGIIGIVLAAGSWRSRMPFPGRQQQIVPVAALALGILVGVALPNHMSKAGAFGFDERKADVLTTLSTSFSPGDARGRLTTWERTLELIADHPVFGVGLGSWQHVYPEYVGDDRIGDWTEPQRPHNDLLWIVAETGIVGGGVYIWILAAMALAVVRALRNASQDGNAVHMAGVALGVVALFGHSMFSYPRERPAPSMLFWLGLGTVICLASSHAPRSGSGRARLPALLASGGAVLTLLMTIQFARFDHHFLKAIEAWKQRRWSDLAQHSDSALEFGVLNHRALLLRGLALRQTGKPIDAIDVLRISQRYHPTGGHLALAAAYGDLARYDDALGEYRKELVLFPNSYGAHFGAADLYAEMGAWDDAVAAYQRALMIAPRDEAGWSLAKALAESGRKEEAAKMYRMAIEAVDSVDRLLALGRTLEALNDVEAALKAYRRAETLSPEDPRGPNNRGALLAKESRTWEAEQAFLEAIRRSPMYARAYHNLGDLYASEDRVGEALEAYERFIAGWTGEPTYVEIARRKMDDLKGLK
jgi:O-antigen ligase/tetratricopeptide (TPR) repeat protein